MDRNEYLQWLDYHGAAYPNWRSNMRAMPNAKDVSDQLQKRLQTVSLEGAKRATDQMVEDPSLKPFRDEDHVTVIRRLAREHDFAKTGKPRWIDNQETFRCLQCRDSGLVLVATARTVKAAQSGVYDELISWWQRVREQMQPEIDRATDPNVPLRESWRAIMRFQHRFGAAPVPSVTPTTWNVWCGCEVGCRRRDHEAMSAEERKTPAPPPMPFFDPELHVVWDSGKWTWENLDACRVHVSPTEKAISAFDEWNSDIDTHSHELDGWR